jgi:hypothetical protein
MAIRSCYIDAFRGKRRGWIRQDLHRDAFRSTRPHRAWAVRVATRFDGSATIVITSSTF